MSLLTILPTVCQEALILCAGMVFKVPPSSLPLTPHSVVSWFYCSIKPVASASLLCASTLNPVDKMRDCTRNKRVDTTTQIEVNGTLHFEPDSTKHGRAPGGCILLTVAIVSPVLGVTGPSGKDVILKGSR